MCKGKQTIPISPPVYTDDGDNIVIVGPTGPNGSSQDDAKVLLADTLEIAEKQLANYTTIIVKLIKLVKGSPHSTVDVSIVYQKPFWFECFGWRCVISFSKNYNNMYYALAAVVAPAPAAVVAPAVPAHEAAAASAHEAVDMAPAPEAVVAPAAVEAVKAVDEAPAPAPEAVVAVGEAPAPEAGDEVHVENDASSNTSFHTGEDEAPEAVVEGEDPAVEAGDEAPAPAAPGGEAVDEVVDEVDAPASVASEHIFNYPLPLSTILENSTGELIAAVHDAREQHKNIRLNTRIERRVFNKWMKNTKANHANATRALHNFGINIVYP